jgi:hypothetical protein
MRVGWDVFEGMQEWEEQHRVGRSARRIMMSWLSSRGFGTAASSRVHDPLPSPCQPSFIPESFPPQALVLESAQIVAQWSSVAICSGSLDHTRTEVYTL